MIPKTIIQTYKQSSLPTVLAENSIRNTDFAKGWTYQLYDDSMIPDYIKEHFGNEMMRRYGKISPMYGAARADFFRYLVLYNAGGLYLDIKSVMTKPLSDVIAPDDNYLLGNWHDCGEDNYSAYGRDSTIANPAGEFQQWFLVSAPRHPFLEAVIHEVCKRIDNYSRRFSGFGRWGTLNTTGPIPYTNAIFPILSRHDYRRVRSFTDLGFRYSLFDGPNQHYEVMPSHYTKNTGPVVVHSAYTHGKNLVRSSLTAMRKRLTK
jgi:mannosyltransferase OCH1-like enzyme